MAENLVLDIYHQRPYASGLALHHDAIAEIGRVSASREFDIRTSSLAAPVSTLSGGNQQKVIVARELSRPLKLLIAAQPTRGVDVGSTEFIHCRVIHERDAGSAVLLVSSELDEIVALADRIAVMYRGQVLAIVPADTPREHLGLLMAGVTEARAERRRDRTTGEDREPNDREPKARPEPSPKQRRAPRNALARCRQQCARGQCGRGIGRGQCGRGQCARAIRSEAPTGGEDVGRHAAPAGSRLTRRSTAEQTSLPSSLARVRTCRWRRRRDRAVDRLAASCASYGGSPAPTQSSVTVLSIFSALVVGAILIVISNNAVLEQFGYFFAQPGAALSGAWSAVSLRLRRPVQGCDLRPVDVAVRLNGTSTVGRRRYARSPRRSNTRRR